MPAFRLADRVAVSSGFVPAVVQSMLHGMQYAEAASFAARGCMSPRSLQSTVTSWGMRNLCGCFLNPELQVFCIQHPDRSLEVRGDRLLAIEMTGPNARHAPPSGRGTDSVRDRAVVVEFAPRT